MNADSTRIAAAAKAHPVNAIVIGASAGGVEALLKLLTLLPRHFQLPIIAVLHLPERRESQLAELFRQRLLIEVCEAADKQDIEAATLYFAGPDYHLSVEKNHSFSLSCEAPVNFSRPSIDLLMESAADAYGPRLAGILLTGANQDGAAGLAQIGEQGGLTVVQDPKEAQASTMPEAAILKRQPDLILRLDGIFNLILELDKHSC